MESNRKRIRIEFAPLNVAVSTVCNTPNSPITQVYNAIIGQHEPDRTLTPTVILPQVVANAVDGSWPQPQSNHLLADMKWYADGADISTLSDWSNKYSIATEGSLRGALTVKRNILPSEQITLVFKAVLVDARTGINYPIETEPLTLLCTVKSQDTYTMSIGDSQIIQYDPFKDLLGEYNYKCGQGLMTASASAESAATDENAHIRRIPVTVYRGDQTLASGDYTVKYYRMGASMALTELSTADDEVVSFDNTQITLDLRLIDKEDYVAEVTVGSRKVAQMQFSVNRIFPAFNIRPTNGISIAPTDLMRVDEAMVDCDGNIVRYPEYILSMIWKTNTATKTGVTHNEGGRTAFLLADTGIGKDYTNDWLEVYVTAEQKPKHQVALDDGGNELTDQSGTTLIFN